MEFSLCAWPLTVRSRTCLPDAKAHEDHADGHPTQHADRDDCFERHSRLRRVVIVIPIGLMHGRCFSNGQLTRKQSMCPFYFKFQQMALGKRRPAYGTIPSHGSAQVVCETTDKTNICLKHLKRRLSRCREAMLIKKSASVPTPLTEDRQKMFILEGTACRFVLLSEYSN